MAKKTTFTATASTSGSATSSPHSATGVTIDDFVAYLPKHVYIFTVCREIWLGPGVNARLPAQQVLTASGQPKRDKDGNFVYQPATKWLDKHRGIEQATWCPGQPMLIKDRVVVDGGWIERKGVTTFNWYRPPRIELGDAAKAEPWIKHVHRVLHADDAEHCIKWFAHRVQRPAEKINHGLVIGGPQGIGKDSMLEPLKYAVGPWNFHDVSPTHLFGPFNSYAKSVILRVNEGRDLGEIDRFKFYDHTKTYAAAPPDVMRVNEKHIQQYYIFNVIGLIITTNHKTDGLYLPSDDRRHYVAWSDRQKEDFTDEYWKKLWNYYEADGGYGHVSAYLTELDISDFNPKAPPPKTQAFWDIVNVGQAPEDAELADVIDAMKGPDALTPKMIVAAATGTAAEWLTELKSRRALPHRLERCGYICIRNPNAKDGYWVVDKERQPIYAKSTLSVQQRVEAAKKLSN
jgi:hypothetical protein